MVRAVEGTFKDGKLELPELGATLRDGARVIVWLIDETAIEPAGDMDSAERERLMQEMFAEMDLGLRMGGRPYARREDLYDRLNRW